MTEYREMTKEFLKKTNTEIKIKICDYGLFFPSDKVNRNIYDITISRKVNGNIKEISFMFGDSVHNTKNGLKPSGYDILACLTKYDVGSFDDFCDEFGYISSGMKISEIIKTYQDVKKEWEDVQYLFGDVLDELREIQ